MKDALRAAGCQWNPDAKAWFARTPDAARQASEIMASASTRDPGAASDRQVHTIDHMLVRLRCVAMFDAFAGTGDQMADNIEGQIMAFGGRQALTRKQASQIIEAIACYIDDEM